MSTESQELQQLKSDIAALRRDINLIADLLSRHGLMDIRIQKHDLEILDRIENLEARLTG